MTDVVERSTSSETSTAWIPRPEATLALAPRRFQTWVEEYSAACLCALPLLAGTAETGQAPEAVARRRDELADEAVSHLRKAMSSTPSWYAAQRRDWVLSEDPDLDGLRQCRQFKHFEAIYFPSPAPTPGRPPRVNRWEQSRYTHRLLVETGRRWERVWHQRREVLVSRLDPHVVIGWSKDEAHAWRMVECLATDYRHWRVRCDLIEQMKVWSAKYGFDQLCVEVPRFARENGRDHDDSAAHCDLVEQEVVYNETRLSEVARHLVAVTGPPNHSGSTQPQEGGSAPDTRLERLQVGVCRDFWHRADPKLYLRVCDVRAAAWQRLHEWMDEPPDDDSSAGSDFAGAVSEAARLSGTFHGLWCPRRSNGTPPAPKS